MEFTNSRDSRLHRQISISFEIYINVIIILRNFDLQAAQVEILR